VNYISFIFPHNSGLRNRGKFACNCRILVSDFQSPPEEVGVAVDVALEVGYRHIDTAFFYRNEAAIGNTLKKWFDSGRLKREDVFIVTKVSSAEKFDSSGC
jgi:diketogulonate reductase-like aldo/keto reductase